MHSLTVVKGHGTQNDFILLVDPEGRYDLTPPLISALCDRRAGLGADGVIRVIRSEALPDGVPLSGQAEWFMDYRNADGSLAQMCGNGARVFVTYLLQEGLAKLGDGERLAIGTRAGVKQLRRAGEMLAVDLGPWRIVGGEAAARSGSDVKVSVRGEPAHLPGLSVNVGNPHVVVALPALPVLRAADLSVPPVIEPALDEGSNVELVVPRHFGTAGEGHLTMRVHERGVGETRSCGTGAVAAVLAARVWAGLGVPPAWHVDVPGGRLRVTVPGTGGPAETMLAGDSVELAGPAVLVARADLDEGWLRDQAAADTDTGAGQPLPGGSLV